jgi:hypothetical protein
MTRAELTVILNKLSKIYGGQIIDAEKVSAYNSALGQLPRYRVMRACSTLMRTNTFFPRPSEILAEVRKDTSATPVPFDEACYWIMFVRGITDPAELTDKDISEIIAKCGLAA